MIERQSRLTARLLDDLLDVSRITQGRIELRKQRLVELHGGTVAAQSEGRGKGSTFEVRLPLAAGPPGVDTAEEPHAAATSVPAQRILLVEDNRDAAAALADLLGLWGHEVRLAGEGEEGLRVAAGFQPQVVLVDIGLPGMDGYELARRLRRELPAATRLIAVTGYGQEEDRQRSKAAGFDAHLTKPVEAAALRGVLGALPP